MTIEYDENNNPLRVDTIVISTQHDEFDYDDNRMQEKIKSDLIKILIPRVINKLPDNSKKLFGNDIKYHINLLFKA